MYDQIKSEGAVSGFCMQGDLIDFLCRKTLYKTDKETKKIVYQKQVFEKEGSARIMTADKNRIYISDFCDLYALDREDYEIVGKWRLGTDLSSDICGMTVDEKRIYCSIRNGRIITVDKLSFTRHEYLITDASMWSLKIFENYLLCGTVNGQLLLLDRDTMSEENRLMLSRQNIRNLYVNDTIVYAACQDKSLFKIDLPNFSLSESRKHVHKKMFDCVGIYNEMLVTVSHPCSEIALWDRNTLEKKKEIKIPLKLSGNAQIDGSDLYITSRNMNGIGIIDLGKH